MGKPYSMDLRERVVAAVLSGGLSCNQAAKQFGVGISTAINWVKRLRETGSVAPGKVGGYRPKSISGEHEVWLLQRIKDGEFTLRGLVGEFAERGLKVDYRSVWEFVHAEKLSFKKSMVAGERDRPDVARRRARWIKYQDRIEAERLVFIDETWTKTNMAPLRGWAPRGERLIAKVPHGHWNTTTFLAALRHDRIDAPWLLPGPIDGESFQAYIGRSCFQPCAPAISSSWTISAATKAKPCVSSSARPALSCCFYRNTRPTSIPSSRSSPSSSICCEKPPREPVKPCARKLAKSSAPLPPRSVPTTSRIQAMHKRKIITL